ncbi:MAG: CinA family nicotinamide mononucleotide deamidase-related protein [Verrucomicrobiales bacterium]
MRIEVINTGTELLLGQTLNTHVHWLGGELLKLGLFIQRQVCVPDGPEIRRVLVEAFSRSDVVLVTGGLGPTSDDVTREITAELLALPLEESAAALTAITTYLARRHREMNAHSRRQAMVPRGARALVNACGTAPGLYFPPLANAVQGIAMTPHLFLLPGPPRELHPMFNAEVAPRLAKWHRQPVPKLKNFALCGVGEAEVSAAVEPSLRQAGLAEFGYCVRPGEVIVRCVGDEQALEQCGEIIRTAFPVQFFSDGHEPMEVVVVRLLGERNEMVATAESCTGGLLAHRLTNVPGASAVFATGFVTYANSAKENMLGVPTALLRSRGAVSKEVAQAMAEGALARSGAPHALAVTGIAGPTGGSVKKPVGTVFVALASATRSTIAVHERFPFEREVFKSLATQTALDVLRRRLLGFL